MNNLKIFSQNDLTPYLSKRAGEIKLGEVIQTYHSFDEACNAEVDYVIMGIPEDIGVRANFGIGGAKSAFDAFLNAFLNIQSNNFLKGSNIGLLGFFEFEEVENEMCTLRNAVSQIDEQVAPTIEQLVKRGKTPIIIGGGHNNAYPILKGVASAIGMQTNTINIDAHADLRNTEEGRHSGNGFSNALNEGYLGKYGIFGLHQNYNNQTIVDLVANNENIHAVYLDTILRGADLQQSWQQLLRNIPTPCGLEIDLDSICGVLSSASSETGLTLNEARSLLLRGDKRFNYLHICEGAYKMADGRIDGSISKTIAYLVSDFIKKQSEII